MTSENPAGNQSAELSQRLTVDPPQEIYKSEIGNVKEGVVVAGHGNRVLTVGDVTLSGTFEGAVIIAPGQEIVVSRRPGKLELRPEKPELLDRERERSASFIMAPTTIEIFGESGIGKSTLLAFLAHDLYSGSPERYHDGVAWHYSPGLSFDDLLFDIWSMFYKASCPWTFRPPPMDQRMNLSVIDALLLLDDAGLSENESRSLAIACPRSTVVLSAEDQRIFGFGTSIPVLGLPFQCMRRLADIQLERLALQNFAVPDDVLARCWEQHHGNPYLVARDISRWAYQGFPPGTGDEAAEKVLCVVKALEKPVPSDVLEAVVNSPSVQNVADELVKAGQLKSNSPRYSYPWPQMDISAQKADEYCSRALQYIAKELDLRSRSDLHPLALQLLKWADAHPGLNTEAAVIARQLSDTFMASGHLDRWREALEAAVRIADNAQDAQTGAWARHNLGAVALCRGDFHEASDYLRTALQMRLDNKSGAVAVNTTEELLREAETREGEEGSGTPSGGGGSVIPPSGSGGKSGAGQLAEEGYIKVQEPEQQQVMVEVTF